MIIEERKRVVIELRDGTELQMGTDLGSLQNFINLMITGTACLNYSLSLQEMTNVLLMSLNLTTANADKIAREIFEAADYIHKERTSGG